MSEKVRIWIALGALIAIGLLLRVPQTSYGLPAARFSDSIKTIDVATRLADNWRLGRFTLDPKDYQYPTLYTDVVAATLLVARSARSSEVIGRMVTTLASALTALFVYLIASRLRSCRCGLTAAAFVSLGFLFVLQGRQPTPDALQMALFCASVVPLLGLRPSRRSAFVLSGSLLGLAIGTKYTALVFAVPIVTAALWETRRSASELIGNGLAWMGGAAVGFLVATPAFFIRADAFVSRALLESGIQRSGDLSLNQAGVWNYFFLRSAAGVDWPYAESLRGTLGIPFAVSSILALAWAFSSGSRRRDARMIGLASSVLGGVLYFSFFSRILAIRFLLPAAAILAVLIAAMIEEVSFAIASRRPNSVLCHPWLPTALLATLVLIPNAVMAATYVRALATPDSRLAAAEWIFGHLPPGTSVLNFIHGPALPARRYRLLTRPLPEYRFELKDTGGAAATLEELDNNGVDCVVWNNFYWHDLDSPHPDRKIADYYSRWAEFYRELQRRSDRTRYARFAGPVSPTVEIFCREQNRTWQAEQHEFANKP